VNIIRIFYWNKAWDFHAIFLLCFIVGSLLALSVINYLTFPRQFCGHLNLSHSVQSFWEELYLTVNGPSVTGKVVVEMTVTVKSLLFSMLFIIELQCIAWQSGGYQQFVKCLWIYTQVLRKMRRRQENTFLKCLWIWTRIRTKLFTLTSHVRQVCRTSYKCFDSFNICCKITVLVVFSLNLPSQSVHPKIRMLCYGWLEFQYYFFKPRLYLYFWL